MNRTDLPCNFGHFSIPKVLQMLGVSFPNPAPMLLSSIFELLPEFLKFIRFVQRDIIVNKIYTPPIIGLHQSILLDKSCLVTISKI